MPQAQVVNFGEDPYANAMGGFAKNFLTEINEREGQRRNDELFQNIIKNYGEDANPTDVLKDIISAEGFDQEYKKNKIKDIVDWATLSAKTDLNGYEAAKLKQREAELKVREEGNKIAEQRVANEKDKAETTKLNTKRDLTKQINDYSTKTLKNAGLELPAHDQAELDDFMDQLVTEKDMSIPQAFSNAFPYIEARRDKIDNVQITPPGWTSSGTDQAREKAIQELVVLHDEDGIDNQKDLRAIVKRAKWSDEEATKILTEVFKRLGKALRGRPRKEMSPEKSALIPFEKQGEVSEEAGIAEIFGKI